MKRLFLAAWGFAAAILLASGTAASAAPTMREVLRALYAVHDLSAVDLSPSGEAVVWQESFHSAQHLLDSPRVNALYLRRLTGGAPLRITAGAPSAYYDEEDPVWSPDGSAVAFLSDARSKGRPQLCVADANGAHVRPVGKLDGNVARLTWSPDGKTLAVLYIAAAHRKTGAFAPGARDVGVIGTIVDEQRLAATDVATGATRLLTPADTYVYEYGWSPDGRAIAVTYAKGNGDNNWWVARLARVDVATATLHDLFAPAFQMNDPQWSPDGTRIAAIGGIMSDFGSTGGDLYLVDANTGQAHDATPDAPISVQSLHWNDASSLDLVAHVPGAMHLLRLDLASGRIATLTDRDESIGSWSSIRGGSMIALERSSFDDPPEVWAGSPSSLRRISNRNAGAVRFFGKAVSLRWTSGGFSDQGWLIYPLDYDAGRTYPMVTIVHGGPSAQSLPSFANRNLSGLSSQGYFVFMPNPRGSFGQGEAFTRANIKDLGYGDWRDDLAGVDAAIKAAPIDANRLGLMGWSYGGYMAMWGETQTARFKAIVAGAGIVNWQSYYGQNKIDQWMIPFFGASVYQDPAVYAKSSPITFVEQSKTPVLILQGERDEEVPAPQAFEFWHAMETLGVPTKLIVYADEGHGPQQISNQIDILEQTLQWFNRYVAPSRN